MGPGKPVRAIIFANGVLNDSAPAAVVRPDDLVIAADGGANQMNQWGLTPHILIGDLDSIDPALLATYRRAGIPIEKYPRHKDFTDLELALDHAVGRGCKQIIVFGALGARLDMSLANIMLLAAPKYHDVDIRLIRGNQKAVLVNAGTCHRVVGAAGDTVSLIALGQDALGITLDGMQYPLVGESLKVGSTRGISNRLTGSKGEVRLEKGRILCIHTRRG